MPQISNHDCEYILTEIQAPKTALLIEPEKDAVESVDMSLTHIN
jgi:hypothetical protein